MLPEASLENGSNHGSAGRQKYGPKDKSKGNGLLWYRYRRDDGLRARLLFLECLRWSYFLFGD